MKIRRHPLYGYDPCARRLTLFADDDAGDAGGSSDAGGSDAGDAGDASSGSGSDGGGAAGDNASGSGSGGVDMAAFNAMKAQLDALKAADDARNSADAQRQREQATADQRAAEARRQQKLDDAIEAAAKADRRAQRGTIRSHLSEKGRAVKDDVYLAMLEKGGSLAMPEGSFNDDGDLTEAGQEHIAKVVKDRGELFNVTAASGSDPMSAAGSYPEPGQYTEADLAKFREAHIKPGAVFKDAKLSASREQVDWFMGHGGDKMLTPEQVAGGSR